MSLLLLSSDSIMKKTLYSYPSSSRHFLLTISCFLPNKQVFFQFAVVMYCVPNNSGFDTHVMNLFIETNLRERSLFDMLSRTDNVTSRSSSRHVAFELDFKLNIKPILLLFLYDDF